MIRITTAPEAYDYPATVIVSVDLKARDGYTGSPYRRVMLTDAEDGYYAEYQIARYRSGAYPVFTIEEYERLAETSLL